MNLSVLLVDDHRILSDGLRALLSGEENLDVVGTATTGNEAVEMTRTLKPDVVVMDLMMPGLNGVDATRQVRSESDTVKVVCLSSASDERSVSSALRAGASGYVIKTAAVEELANAIRTVASGGVFLSPPIARLMVEDLTRPSGSRFSPIDLLSSRERQVLQLIAEGHTTKAVAYRLQVSVKTVETHRRNLMEKLHSDSIAKLTRLAVREGLIPL